MNKYNRKHIRAIVDDYIFEIGIVAMFAVAVVWAFI